MIACDRSNVSKSACVPSHFDHSCLFRSLSYLAQMLSDKDSCCGRKKKHSHKRWISHSSWFRFPFHSHTHRPSFGWHCTEALESVEWWYACFVGAVKVSRSSNDKTKMQYNKIVNVPRIFNIEALKWAMRVKVQVCYRWKWKQIKCSQRKMSHTNISACRTVTAMATMATATTSTSTL